MKRLTLIASALGLSALASCTSLNYGDANAEETVSIEWGSTDLQTNVEAMTASLLSAPGIAHMNENATPDDPRTKLYFGGIQNKTSEHVDTTGISDMVRTNMVQSGRFRVVAGPQGQEEIGDQVRFQQGSGRVDPAQAKAFGRQLGADAIIYGVLRSIEKDRGRAIGNLGTKTEDQYYSLTLNFENIETGELVWSQFKEIRKVKSTGLFGS